MGLDIALGVVVLIAAIRGWFRGFMLQAIRLGGLVGCVYLADPVRGLARPFVVEHLQSIRPELLDKLLWWAAAALCYVVTTGVATGLVKVASRRRRPFEGERESHRGNQSAGALLGALKGAVAVAFLLAGMQKYAGQYQLVGGWAGEQVETSKALAWSEANQPAEQIWASPPVRMFVGQVRRMGLDPLEEELRREAQDQVFPVGGDPASTVADDKPAPAPAVRTARRSPDLALPPPPAPEPDQLDPHAPGFDRDAAIDVLREDLERRRRSSR